jgi:hypothetical protein
VTDHSDRAIALEATDIAFADTIRHLVEQLHLGLADSRGETNGPQTRFEAGLTRAKQARELAMASIAKLLT